MFAFLANYYSWSFQEILKLPIRAFFSFYSEGIKMEARQYREILDIQIATPQYLDYYKYLRTRYNGIIDPSYSELPQKPHPVIGSGTSEAKRLLKNIFSNVKQGMGYGR